jgi:hypothetical protein
VQPGAKEVLGATVGASCIEVPNARSEGRVQQLVSAILHRLDGAVLEVLAMPEV